MNRRRFLLLAGVLPALARRAACERLRKPDWRNPAAYIRYLQRSREPDVERIRQQIARGPQDLARERAAARREGIPATPAALLPPAPPAELNAAPLYEKLVRLLKEKPLDEHADEFIGRLGPRFVPTPEQLAVLRRALAERRDVMELVHQAADRPQCLFRRDWSLGPKTPFYGEFSTMRQAIRLLNAEGTCWRRTTTFPRQWQTWLAGSELPNTPPRTRS
jgi:hypothetical protein